MTYYLTGIESINQLAECTGLYDTLEDLEGVRVISNCYPQHLPLCRFTDMFMCAFGNAFYQF